MSFAVVRVRGQADVHPKTKETLKLLRLHRPNHCVIVPSDDQTLGMLNVVKDHVTWGEASVDVLEKVLTQRGRVIGDDPLTDETVAERTEYGSIRDLAEALADGEVALRDLDGVKPVLRLHPPRKGYEGTKRPVSTGGALGYRGSDIDELLERMV